MKPRQLGQQLWTPWQVLRIVVGWNACLVAGAMLTGCAPWPVRQQHLERARYEFALIGDAPYSEADAAQAFPNLLDELNRERLAFVVHDGDIKAGAAPCTDELLEQRRDLFNRSLHPFVLVFGDNEWTDCGKVKDDPRPPEERLERLRQLFAAGDRSLGRRTLRLERQSDGGGYPAFRENFRWIYGRAMFVGLNIVGSANHHGSPEFDVRNRANLAWLRESFSLARKQDLPAIMIIIQANPRFDLRRGDPGRAGYEDFLQALEEETMRFAKPVVLVHGDTHYFRIDKPMMHARSGRRVENFTRVETFGNPDVHWVRARLDWRDPDVFTFRQEIVEANRIRHEP